MRAVDRVQGVLRELWEDTQIAAQHLVLVSVGGSILLPRSGRRLLYRTAGARVASAPGGAFMFSGRPANLEVGPNVYFNQRVFVDAKGRVTIGAGSAVGMDVLIVTSHHPIDGSGRWSSEAVGVDVEIGERVWIGARAVLLPGAVVESDVIIAAGSVVVGRCTSGGLYAGVPARRIRDHGAPSS